MGDIPEKKDRRLYLRISLISNLTILGTFKYFNFFTTSVSDIFEALNMDYVIPHLDVILPVGISFYTFQTLSYSVDIYRGNLKPEKSFGKFALYVCFFPQLVAGPIERAKDLLKQFDFKTKFECGNMTSGLRLILLGLFKKVMVADQIESMTRFVFDNPENQTGVNLWFGSMLFAQRIYCDFSAYSDIAQGSARMLGVNLIDNFRLPFYSKNASDFWGNWHVSLMNWFKDYIMFPLIRKRWDWKKVFLVVFLISGFWHGAQWTMVLWGLFHGAMMIQARLTHKWRASFFDKLNIGKDSFFRKGLQILAVYMIFTASSPFFLGNTLENAWRFAQLMYSDFSTDLFSIFYSPEGRTTNLYLGGNALQFMSTIGAIFLLEVAQSNFRKIGYEKWITGLNPIIRWSIYIIITIMVCIYSNYYSIPYIYFQF